jgi:hypothetical protein
MAIIKVEVIKKYEKIWALLTIVLITSLLLVRVPPVYADKESVQ